MKNLSFFVFAFALCASTSYAAINCGTLPSCSDLGYTDKVAECPSSSEVLKCPFDTTYGKCTRGPSIGDLKYSLRGDDHDGWLKCDGQSLDTTQYAALYNIIKSNYGMDGTKFRVPDYRGFFLRAYGTATNNKALSSFGGSANSDLKTPQKEQLPNVSGKIQYHTWSADASGVFHNSGDKYSKVANGGEEATYSKKTFNLKWGSEIYIDNGHVIPANYAANIFIYAGR